MDIVILDDFQLEVSRDEVLHLMDCYPESAIYDEIVEEYEELKPRMSALIRPRGVLSFGTVRKGYEVEGVLEEGQPVLYLIITIGKEASELGSEFFQEGDAVKGMLADVLADSYLFAMDQEIQRYIKQECIKRQCGVKSRLEAPLDIPMSYQRIAYEETGAAKYLQMMITTGEMLDPLKSSCGVYVLTEDCSQFKLKHDCRKCTNYTCKMRKVPDTTIKVYQQDGMLEREIQCAEQESILESYRKNGGQILAPCGGHGSCGKCKIKVLEGIWEPTKEDMDYFSCELLNQGYRLSCCAYPKEDCAIQLVNQEESEFSVLGSELPSNTEVKSERVGNNVAYAIDIGTTTIAISLIDVETKQVIDTYTCANSQRSYGADVIARIQASTDGMGNKLRELVENDILKGLKCLGDNYQVRPEYIKKLVIGANTTMTHLLLGFPCKTLGIFPFVPVDISCIKYRFEEVFSNASMNGFPYTKAEVVFIPGISTFVGGDIVAGLYHQQILKQENYQIFVDLGTNGEMAIGNKDGIIVASTAMGPAFEGGNITCGVASVAGAIYKVDMEENTFVCDTIGGKSPIGLCGTGVVEIVAELLANEWIDETGLLDEEHFEEGVVIAKTSEGKDIVFTQKDVREIQLAKSAVRAGIEALIQKVGATYNDIDRVYLAGGFGYHMNHKKAVQIGMFPTELEYKIVSVGNTSLLGSIHCCMEKEVKQVLEHIVEQSEELSLSTDKTFNEGYVNYMFFE